MDLSTFGITHLISPSRHIRYRETTGNWQGLYGTDGYNAINDTTSYPSYAQVLDSRSLNSFGDGAYLVWTVRGHVKLRFTYTGTIFGDNAVISGIFFKPGP